MRTHLVVLVLGVVLGGGVQAAVPGGGPEVWAQVDDDEPEAAPDTVYVARMDPVDVVAERSLQNGEEASSAIRVASSLARGGETAARSDRTETARPTDPGAGVEGRARSRSRRGGQQGRANARSERNVGIGGFVMDETFSVVGSDFYSAFYDAWSEPEDAKMFTVHVSEEPSPQFGARLAVKVDDTMIYRTFLRPNNRKIQQAAQTAAQRAQIYLKRHHEPREIY